MNIGVLLFTNSWLKSPHIWIWFAHHLMQHRTETSFIHMNFGGAMQCGEVKFASSLSICTGFFTYILFITLWSVRAMPSTSTPLAFHDTNRLALQEGDLDGFQAEPWRGTLHRKQCKIPHQSGKGQGGFKFPYQSNPLVDGNGANQRFESTFMNHQSNDCP